MNIHQNARLTLDREHMVSSMPGGQSPQVAARAAENCPAPAIARKWRARYQAEDARPLVQTEAFAQAHHAGPLTGSPRCVASAAQASTSRLRPVAYRRPLAGF